MKNVFYFFLLITLTGFAKPVKNTCKSIMILDSLVEEGKIVLESEYNNKKDFISDSLYFKNDSFSLSCKEINFDFKNLKVREINVDIDSTSPVTYYVKYYIENAELKTKINEIENYSDNFFLLKSSKDSLIAQTKIYNINKPPVKLNVDLLPSLNQTDPHRMNIDLLRNLSLGNNYLPGYTFLSFWGKANISSKPDSNSLNSIKLGLDLSTIYGNLGRFKYFGITARVNTEHPQNFRETNIDAGIVLSTVIPFTDRIARMVTGNTTNSSIGLLVQPELQFVKNTAVKDSNCTRFCLNGGWDIPLFKGQYARFYGAAYFQDKFKPRSYIEMTIEQDLIDGTALVAKWINGVLAPKFTREVGFSIGVRFK